LPVEQAAMLGMTFPPPKGKDPPPVQGAGQACRLRA